MDTTSRTLAGLVAGLFASAIAGCGPTCKEVRDSFDSARAAELAADESPDDESDETPADATDDGAVSQFAVAMRTTFVERRADDLARSALEEFIASSRQLEVAGVKPIRVTASPNIRDFEVGRASDACDHCFHLRGELDGSLDVQIPLLGTRSVPLDGSFDFVAPVDVEPDAESGGAVVLDLGEVLRHEAVPFAISVAELRKSWRQTVESLLSSTLVDELLEGIEPVEIAEFRTPEFGIEGLDLQPTGIRIPEEGNRIVALFSTSVPMARAPDDEQLVGAAEPAEGRDLAVAFPPRFVASAVAFGFRNGSVQRRYTRTGRADEKGPVRATIRNFRVGDGVENGTENKSPNSLPVALDFRAFHLPSSGSCYWFDGTASGTASVTESEANVTLESVSFTDASSYGLSLEAANWAATQFVESGGAVVQSSISGETLSLPGSDAAFDSLALRTSRGFVTLSGHPSADHTTEADDAQ